MQGLSECKASESNVRRIRVKYIVKKVEDSLKTYLSTEMDISSIGLRARVSELYRESRAEEYALCLWRILEVRMLYTYHTEREHADREDRAVCILLLVWEILYSLRSMCRVVSLYGDQDMVRGYRATVEDT
ncbi:hypothetical protein Tco_1077952 [Tanacetum coccineum]